MSIIRNGIPEITIENDLTEGPLFAGMFRTRVPTGYSTVRCGCGFRRFGTTEEMKPIFRQHAELHGLIT